jgi:hypothetical protein
MSPELDRIVECHVDPTDEMLPLSLLLARLGEQIIMSREKFRLKINLLTQNMSPSFANLRNASPQISECRFPSLGKCLG